MALPILVTKLHAPPPLSRSIPRPRLTERLDAGLRHRLTLVSAPAGFGKTTLVSEWAASHGHRTAWLSLDDADADLSRFLAYLIAALRTVEPDIGDAALRVLESAQAPAAEVILTSLINEVAVLPGTIVLVLDDYHAVDSRPVDQALAFLLEHLPSRLHLVITTREDPQLPLTRLRSRGQMTEVRAADLRFTADEAAAFLDEAMGLRLSASDVAALEARTEGWIAGLQLAALSMQGRDDVTGFIRDFAGDDRYIVDYLVDEVLRRQPEPMRAFLLRTSVLDRLSGPLCDAVTGQDQGSARLAALERGNVFVVPLDDRRRWYRYHHLFKDVLRAYLLDEHPDQLPVLHRRASEWYAQHGDISEAIRHALAAEEVSLAADLIERAGPAMRRGRLEATLLGWLRALPDDVVRERPVLGVDYAGVLLSNGVTEGVETRLRDAERWLEAPSDEMVVVDEEAFRRLPVAITVYRAGLALALGDMPSAVAWARQALDVVADDDHLWRGAAAALLGLAAWSSGDLDTAYRSYDAGMTSLLRAGNISDVIGGSIALADIRITQGRLRDAMRIYEHGLRLAAEHGAPAMRGTADMHVGMSGICREWGDLDAAAQHLHTSEEQGEHTGFPQYPYRLRVALARIREAEGDLDGAIELLDEAERRYASDFYPNIHPVAALRARLWVRQGRLADALAWARERGLTAGDGLNSLREYEHITLARLLIARSSSEGHGGMLDEAVGLLERLLAAAEAGGRTGSAIEILVLLALAHDAQGAGEVALAPLERALKLAAPEGYVRTFVDEGASMARLLSEAHAHGLIPDYTSKLIDLLDAGAPVPPGSPLAEPISEREREVLRLIADGLSNREIADRLYLALDTVKGHNRRIFAKLDVERRTQAIVRARELGLL